jgi:hypothetical protein
LISFFNSGCDQTALNLSGTSTISRTISCPLFLLNLRKRSPPSFANWGPFPFLTCQNWRLSAPISPLKSEVQKAKSRPIKRKSLSPRFLMMKHVLAFFTTLLIPREVLGHQVAFRRILPSFKGLTSL